MKIPLDRYVHVSLDSKRQNMSRMEDLFMQVPSDWSDFPFCPDVLLSDAGPIFGIPLSEYKSISDVLRVFFSWHLYCTGLRKKVLWLLFLL